MSTQHLSDRINGMATSATLAMAAKARELKTAGKDIIPLQSVSFLDGLRVFLIML